ncbi:MAG TPA: serine hydrolase domain-containing protein [Acidobacteriaceae bacterium]|jgi:CubicO group peptidase (beta-lactamase class C family)|nr:serine hydrolase domain-containing protein [Acidobacteriaceae bacterium]
MQAGRSARSDFRSLRLLFILFAMACDILPAAAEQSPPVAGDYTGSLGPLQLRLHLKAAANESLSCTLDSPNQDANGLACADVHRDGTSLSFTVPVVHGSWKGTVNADGRTLAGTWNQGTPMPLTFARDMFVPAAKPSPVDGFWLGRLHAGSEALRIQITVRSDASGHEDCSLDSLDQHASGLPCANVTFAAPHFNFDVPSVKGHWSGELAADGNKLTGTWSQGAALPLELDREQAAQTAPAIRYDSPLPPVTVANLEHVLRQDFEHAHAFESGILAPSTGIGISVGVLDHDARRVFAYGAAKPDSLFEIGSITKTFTGLILAQMVEQGKVKLDEPVRELLPAGTVAKPSGQEITLLDLATQHSGLPRMPDNFHPGDPQNPYADYRAADLYAFIAKHGVERPAHTDFLYSNVGFGLLGQALADRAAMPYPQLLRKEVTGPLGMHDTTVALSAAQQSRFLAAHDGVRKPAHAWDLDAMAGAGAIRSTAGDMLTYLAAQLHPASSVTSSESPEANTEAKTLAAAISASHELREDGPPGTRIALAWMYIPEIDQYWHNGATGGYNALALFNLKADRAVVVLVNMENGAPEGSAEQIGQHILQRLDGKPAISLAP